MKHTIQAKSVTINYVNNKHMVDNNVDNVEKIFLPSTKPCELRKLLQQITHELQFNSQEKLNLLSITSI